MDVFFSAELGLDRLVELGWRALCTDSLVQRAASDNVENEEKDRFSKQIRYSSNIQRRQMSMSIPSSIGLQQSRALSRNLFMYMSRSSPRHYCIRSSLGRENLASG